MARTRINRFCILPLTLLILGGGCFRGMDTVKKSYETYEAAAAAGLLDMGYWLPGFLPPSATRISVVRDCDSNEVWVRFSFSKADLADMVGFCEEIHRDDLRYPRSRSLWRVRWWPKHLRRESPAPEGRYTYYRCRHTCEYMRPHFAFMAVSDDSSTVWYWIHSD